MSWTASMFRRLFSQPKAHVVKSTKRRGEFKPGMENLEAREVPAAFSGVDFVQGYSFVDNNNNGTFDSGDAPKAGAVIQLTGPNGTTQQATTDANGYYRFQNLVPGTNYRLTEINSQGLTPRSVSALTLLSSSSNATANSISLRLGADDGSVVFSRTGGPINDVPATAYTLNGGVFNDFTNQLSTGNARGFKGFLSTSTGITPEFLTYCIDLFHANPATYSVSPSSQPTTPAGTGLAATTPENIGRIAYLYNTIGRNGFSGTDAGIQEAAFSLAVYELIYDASTDLSGGNYQVLSSTPQAVVTAANQFLTASVGQNQSAIFFNVNTPPDSFPNLSNSQGMIGTEFVNFANMPMTPPPPATAQLGDFVWNDLNRNGIQDQGEPGINGVAVTLFANGTPVAQTTTSTNPSNPSQNGFYQFTNLTPGVSYVVCFATPAGFTRTTPFSGTDTGLDSNMNVDDGCAPAVILAPGESNQSIDAGFFMTPTPAVGRLAGHVFVDCNDDGIKNGTDVGISGVTITLTGANGQSFTTITDANGNYSFANLPSGLYTLTQSQPAGYLQGRNTAGTPVNGTINGDVISNIQINGGALAGYNFAERVTTDAIDVTLTKTANKDIYQPGELVTYTYTLTNNSLIPVSGLRIVDDNGTAGRTLDDFVVAENISLAPGESRSFTATRAVPIQLVQVVKGQVVDAGQLIVERLASGDYKVTFIQDENNANDNRYGTGAVRGAGWNKSRGFNALVGSDHADFEFRDANGRVVLAFQVDYISSTAKSGGQFSFPSGFGSLGVLGGEGKMFVGSASSILSATTSLTENLKLYPNGYLVNSPVETAPGSGISADPNAPNWDYSNSYTVVISASAFGSAGFGGVRVTDIHNSPGKNGVERGPGTPVETKITNVATVSITVCNVTETVTATETVTIKGETPNDKDDKCDKDDKKKDDKCDKDDRDDRDDKKKDDRDDKDDKKKDDRDDRDDKKKDDRDDKDDKKKDDRDDKDDKKKDDKCEKDDRDDKKKDDRDDRDDKDDKKKDDKDDRDDKKKDDKDDKKKDDRDDKDDKKKDDRDDRDYKKKGDRDDRDDKKKDDKHGRKTDRTRNDKNC